MTKVERIKEAKEIFRDIYNLYEETVLSPDLIDARELVNKGSKVIEKYKGHRKYQTIIDVVSLLFDDTAREPERFKGEEA